MWRASFRLSLDERTFGQASQLSVARSDSQCLEWILTDGSGAILVHPGPNVERVSVCSENGYVFESLRS